MKCRALLCLVALFTAVAGRPVAGADTAAATFPNFVFILVDDLGWSDLGCYGADLHQTPHIDRFAQQAIRFTDAYAAAPVCSPTRASILTGKCPARLHMTVWREAAATPPTNRALIPPVAITDLPHEEVTFAEVLHQAGYTTAHVGKWHLGAAGYYPETQGYDINIGGTLWGAPPTFFWPYRGSKYFGGELRYVPGLPWGKPGEYLTDRLTDEAISIVRKVRDRPFLLNLAYHTVHTPIEAPEENVGYFTPKLKEGLHHKNATYAAMVQKLDENVGRLLAELDKLGIAQRTVVVLTSDNGGFVNAFQGQTVTCNAPLRSGKGSLYEGGIRVPMMIRWPGVSPAGTECRVPVISSDYYRTILEIAGQTGDAKHNATVDGRSLVPLLRHPDGKLERDTLCFHYPHYYPTTSPVGAIRQGSWKLLECFEDNHIELYNLADDLAEQHDLAADMPDRAAQLRQQLHEWRSAMNAQMPKPNPNRNR